MESLQLRAEKYLWEATAKKGIVPKWVSWLACYGHLHVLLLWLYG